MRFEKQLGGKTMVIKWLKKEKRWDIGIYRDIPKEIKKDYFTCPKCGKDLSRGGEVIHTTMEKITYHQWKNSSIQDLKEIIQRRCNYCFKLVSLLEFPEKVQDYYEMALITPMKKINQALVNARIFTKRKKEIEVGIPKYFQFGVKIGDLGIDIICGQCDKKNKFKIVDETEKIIQCMECGYFNKVIY